MATTTTTTTMMWSVQSESYQVARQEEGQCKQEVQETQVAWTELSKDYPSRAAGGGVGGLCPVEESVMEDQHDTGDDDCSASCSSALTDEFGFYNEHDDDDEDCHNAAVRFSPHSVYYTGTYETFRDGSLHHRRRRGTTTAPSCMSSPPSHLPPVHESEDYIGSPPEQLRNGEFLCGGWGSDMSRTYQSSCLSSLDVHEVYEMEEEEEDASRSPCGWTADETHEESGTDRVAPPPCKVSMLSIALARAGLGSSSSRVENTVVPCHHPQQQDRFINEDNSWGYFVDTIDC